MSADRWTDRRPLTLILKKRGGWSGVAVSWSVETRLCTAVEEEYKGWLVWGSSQLTVGQKTRFRCQRRAGWSGCRSANQSRRGYALLSKKSIKAGWSGVAVSWSVDTRLPVELILRCWRLAPFWSTTSSRSSWVQKDYHLIYLFWRVQEYKFSSVSCTITKT